jgi:hypothetical protein
VERLEDRALLSAGSPLAAYGQLPLAFEANQGQLAPAVDFLARGSGYTLGLSTQDAHLDLGGGTALDLQLVGANPSAAAVGLDQLITRSNYLVGSDPSQWHTNIPNFGRVEYRNVYPGIDLAYYGNQGQLEYDFVVAPGADPGVIQMTIQGAQSLALDGQGNLVLHEAAGDVIEQAPVVYQDIGGVRQTVAGQFVLQGNTVGFQLGAYDPSRPLVIDPTLSYSTYLDAGPSAMLAIAVDSTGAAYLTGYQNNGPAIVAKLNAAGNALIYQTVLGGNSPNAVVAQGNAIAVDAAGDAYVTGMPGSSFPTTANAYSTTASDGFVTELDPTGASLLYSSFIPGVTLGPSSSQRGSNSGGIAIDSSDNIYVTGPAGSGFATTAGAFQSTLGAGAVSNAFLAEFNPSLSGSASLRYGSYLGGGNTDAGSGVAVDSSGNAYVSGYTNSTNFPTTAGAYQTTLAGNNDAIVAKFNPSLSGSASLVYSTYLGGSGIDGLPQYNLRASGRGIGMIFCTTGPGIAVDSSGDAYVAGTTGSTNFPTTPGAYEPSVGSLNGSDAFVTKLNAAGSGLVYSTYLGTGDNTTRATSVAVDAAGNATVVGLTQSSTFPTVNPIQSHLGTIPPSGKKPPPPPIRADAFVTTFNAAGSALLFSTYLGGGDDDFGLGVARDSSGNLYLAGVTASTAFPTTVGAYQTTPPFGTGQWGGFVAKISSPYAPVLAPLAVAAPSSLAPIPGPFVNLPIVPPAVGGSSAGTSAVTSFSDNPSAESQYLPASGLSLVAAPTNPPIFAAQSPKSQQDLLDGVFASDWNEGE